MKSEPLLKYFMNFACSGKESNWLCHPSGLSEGAVQGVGLFRDSGWTLSMQSQELFIGFNIYSIQPLESSRDSTNPHCSGMYKSDWYLNMVHHDLELRNTAEGKFSIMCCVSIFKFSLIIGHCHFAIQLAAKRI